MSQQVQQKNEFLRVLQNWKDQNGKRITQALTRISGLKALKGDELENTFKGVLNFHREIGRVEESLVDMSWFGLCIKIKSTLKRKLDEAEKERKNAPPPSKNSEPLIVEYPKELTAGKGPTDEKMLKFLFRNFITHFEEAMLDPRTPPFLTQTLKELKYKFEEKPDQILQKRVMSIANRLSRAGSSESKGKMLSGIITPKELSNDDEDLYMDQRARDHIHRLQMEELERAQTGFYEAMKKQINKDACEECRYCHNKAAYCEDQKQIRASDQPMTRFMRCNACEKAWRD